MITVNPFCAKKQAPLVLMPLKGCGQEGLMPLKGCGQEGLMPLKGCGQEGLMPLKGCRQDGIGDRSTFRVRKRGPVESAARVSILARWCPAVLPSQS